MSDINWRPISELSGLDNNQYLLAVKIFYSDGRKVTEYRIGSLTPKDYLPNCVVTEGNRICTVTHFAVIAPPT